jgi:hypothetical protein
LTQDVSDRGSFACASSGFSAFVALSSSIFVAREGDEGVGVSSTAGFMSSVVGPDLPHPVIATHAANTSAENR